MNQDELDTIADDLVGVFALFHKHVMKIDNFKAETSLSRSHIEVIFLLDDLGPLPMSKIGETLYVSKSYVTSLVDRLSSLGLVERVPSQDDRRVTRIVLTDRGREFLDEHKGELRNSIRARLFKLPVNELEELSVSVKKMRRIIPQISPK